MTFQNLFDSKLKFCENFSAYEENVTKFINWLKNIEKKKVNKNNDNVANNDEIENLDNDFEYEDELKLNFETFTKTWALKFQNICKIKNDSFNVNTELLEYLIKFDLTEDYFYSYFIVDKKPFMDMLAFLFYVQRIFLIQPCLYLITTDNLIGGLCNVTPLHSLLYKNYKKQFANQNFMTADFPKNVVDLKVFGSSLIHFLEFRSHRRFDNTSLIPHLDQLISNESLQADPDFLEILMITGMFYDISDHSKKTVSDILDKLRKNDEDFVSEYFQHLLQLYRSEVEITPDTDKRMSKLINKKIDDGVSAYYNLMDIVHTKGYVHEDTIAAVKNYYEQHKGLSIENECLRDGIFGYCQSFLNNLDTESYHEYFEINKVFVSYINTFYNQKFNQNIKDLSMNYINRLLDVYTDKRGRDYQDIKKFVTSTFLDLGFKSEKELVELFKTKK